MKLHERLDFIQASRLAPSRKHLVSVIAGFLGADDNGPAFPSVGTMARLTSMSEAQIHNLLREMAADSLITREDGGRRALFTRLRWEAIAAHVPAASGRGGARAKTPKTAPQAPKTAPMDDAAQLDDGSKDCTHEGAEIGGEGAKTGAMGAKTAPDQTMNSPKTIPEDQPIGAREPNPHLLTALLAFQRSDHMHQTIADRILQRVTRCKFCAAEMDAPRPENPFCSACLPERLSGGTPPTASEPQAMFTDSRPTMDTDPIDNDGATTPPSVPAVSSPSHTDEVSDAPRESPTPADVQATMEPEAGDPRLASTLSPAPATSETSALTDTESRSLPLLISASPPAKPKRKAKTATALDLDAWGLACQSYDTIAGKVRRWDPARGDGRLIAETMAAQGQARIVARFAQAARDPWCLDKRPDVSALCRMGNGIVARLDAAAEQAALDAESRSEAVAASGGMLTHPSAQNASERQAAPKQPVSWPDVLRDLGSDPDHHPDDGPMREHWPRVREAIYSATKSSGDAWLTWCRADDTKRQRVERVLSLVTA